MPIAAQRQRDRPDIPCASATAAALALGRSGFTDSSRASVRTFIRSPYVASSSACAGDSAHWPCYASMHVAPALGAAISLRSSPRGARDRRALHAAGHRAPGSSAAAVRDLALERATGDVDLATAAPPGRDRAASPRAPYAVGRAFGTVVVRTRPALNVQLTTFRSRVGLRRRAPADARSPFGTRLEEDAARRDFTCNALYLDPLDRRLRRSDGRARGPRGGALRCVGDPRERFTEDGLRLLRIARLAAQHGLAIDAETRAERARRSRRCAASPPSGCSAELERMADARSGARCASSRARRARAPPRPGLRSPRTRSRRVGPWRVSGRRPAVSRSGACSRPAIRLFEPDACRRGRVALRRVRRRCCERSRAAREARLAARGRARRCAGGARPRGARARALIRLVRAGRSSRTRARCGAPGTARSARTSSPPAGASRRRGRRGALARAAHHERRPRARRRGARPALGRAPARRRGRAARRASAPAEDALRWLEAQLREADPGSPGRREHPAQREAQRIAEQDHCRRPPHRRACPHRRASGGRDQQTPQRHARRRRHVRARSTPRRPRPQTGPARRARPAPAQPARRRVASRPRSGPARDRRRPARPEQRDARRHDPSPRSARAARVALAAHVLEPRDARDAEDVGARRERREPQERCGRGAGPSAASHRATSPAPRLPARTGAEQERSEPRAAPDEVVDRRRERDRVRGVPTAPRAGDLRRERSSDGQHAAASAASPAPAPGDGAPLGIGRRAGRARPRPAVGPVVERHPAVVARSGAEHQHEASAAPLGHARAASTHLPLDVRQRRGCEREREHAPSQCLLELAALLSRAPVAPPSFAGTLALRSGGHARPLGARLVGTPQRASVPPQRAVRRRATNSGSTPLRRLRSLARRHGRNILLITPSGTSSLYVT